MNRRGDFVNVLATGTLRPDGSTVNFIGRNGWELDDMGPVRSVVLKRYRRVTGTIFLRKCNGEK